MFKKYLIESLLNESKISDYIDNVKGITKTDLETYHNEFPDMKKSDEYNMLSFIVKQHKLGNITPDVAKDRIQTVRGDNHGKFLQNELGMLIDTYMRHKGTLPSYYQTPHGYGDYTSFKRAMNNIEPSDIEYVPETKIKHEDDKIIVNQHLTHKSMIEGGKLDIKNPLYDELNGKAKWCVSADSQLGSERFAHYTSNGDTPAYTITNKTNKRKYAVIADQYTNEPEIRNEKDELISPKKLYSMYPSLRKTNIGLNHLIRD